MFEHVIQCQPESVVNENIPVTETVLIASATATTVVGPTQKQYEFILMLWSSLASSG